MINRRNFTQSVPAGIAGLLLAQWGIDAHAATEQVRIAYPIDVPSWDPSKSAAPNPTALFKCVFDQPLEYTPDSKLLPGVVTAYEWLDKDGLVLQLDFLRRLFAVNERHDVIGKQVVCDTLGGILILLLHDGLDVLHGEECEHLEEVLDICIRPTHKVAVQIERRRLVLVEPNSVAGTLAEFSP